MSFNVNMKVSKILLHNPTFHNTPEQKLENPYLYTLKKPEEDKFSFKEHKLEYFGGLCAGILAAISLTKFMGRNSLPKNIVEIADPNIGLNKVVDYDKVVKILKEQVLYPLKSIDMGEKKLLHNPNLKTGVLFYSDNPIAPMMMKEAFIEHAKTLGIKCFDMNTASKRNPVSNAHKTLSYAEEYIAKNKKTAIADIGNLADKTKIAASKTKMSSNLEKRLVNQEPGTLWVAWTSKGDSVPYFYNNFPVISIRID